MGEARIIDKWDEAKEVLLNSQRPLGIVVISADPRVKNKFVYWTLERTLDAICITSGYCTVKRIKQALKSLGVVCISLTAEDSQQHQKRHKIVTMLYNAGVKEVYGVYLREASERPEAQAARKALEEDPPSADGLAGLITL